VVLFVVFIVERLDGGGTQVGLIRGTMAIGGIVGAILIARLARHVDPSQLLAVGLLGMGGMALLFWNAPVISTAIWVYILLFALSGIPGSAMQVGMMTGIQTWSPPDVLGRVVGVLGASEAAGNAFGSLLVGVLVDRVDLTVLLDVQAGIYVLCGLVILLAISRDPAVAATQPGESAPSGAGS
jgi:MFS family permease